MFILMFGWLFCFMFHFPSNAVFV